jgi:hypothetical protein
MVKSEPLLGDSLLLILVVVQVQLPMTSDDSRMSVSRPTRTIQLTYPVMTQASKSVCLFCRDHIDSRSARPKRRSAAGYPSARPRVPRSGLRAYRQSKVDVCSTKTNPYSSPPRRLPRKASEPLGSPVQNGSEQQQQHHNFRR